MLAKSTANDDVIVSWLRWDHRELLLGETSAQHNDALEVLNEDSDLAGPALIRTETTQLRAIERNRRLIEAREQSSGDMPIRALYNPIATNN
jgi:hypothetical protein